MANYLDTAEVAKHTTQESCWVILYGVVYDVTSFLSEHPGGSNIILALAGKDATAQYDPIHPPGTLEENLPAEAKLGRIDPDSLLKEQKATTQPANTDETNDEPPPLESLLNLDEIESEASKRLSEKCWAYYFSASDDQFSKTWNNDAYRDIFLRPRVFVDCTACDLSTSVLGNKIGVPFFVAPAAMARLAHPDGERGIGRAAARFGGMQIISNHASMTPEQIVEDAPRDQVFGWQLYMQTTSEKSVGMIKRINAMKDRFKFICLTLDAPVPGKREMDDKLSFGQATRSQLPPSQSGNEKKAVGAGIGQQLFNGTAGNLTWAKTLSWLAQHTTLPIVLKGLQTHEDVQLAAQYAPQVKAVILSNHGGRAADTAAPPVHTLLEVRKYCPEVFNKIEIWVDGGIKRGTDVVKALCLGATAVGLGRAPLYGLGAGGQAGVERVFEILEAETASCMRLLGAKAISDLGPRLINSRRVERDIYDGEPGLVQRTVYEFKANL